METLPIPARTQFRPQAIPELLTLPPPVNCWRLNCHQFFKRFQGTAFPQRGVNERLKESACYKRDEM
jgi:hypothetical protein